MSCATTKHVLLDRATDGHSIRSDAFCALGDFLLSGTGQDDRGHASTSPALVALACTWWHGRYTAPAVLVEKPLMRRCPVIVQNRSRIVHSSTAASPASCDYGASSGFCAPRLPEGRPASSSELLRAHSLGFRALPSNLRMFGAIGSKTAMPRVKFLNLEEVQSKCPLVERPPPLHRPSASPSNG